MNKTTAPIEITLSIHGRTYKASNINWDSAGEDLVDIFKGLLICGGYTPAILNNEFGSWEYRLKGLEKEE